MLSASRGTFKPTIPVVGDVFVAIRDVLLINNIFLKVLDGASYPVLPKGSRVRIVGSGLNHFELAGDDGHGGQILFQLEKHQMAVTFERVS
ncbi:MAG: hypothetical protein R3D83_04030 [Caenibius sp.]